MIAKLERRLSWRNQDCAIEIAILRKSTIKSYDFISSGVCKRSQPCIAPYIGRKRGELRIRTPLHVNVCRLMDERYSFVFENRIIQRPRLDQRHGIFFHHLWIGRQAKKRLLSQAAKANAFNRVIFKPVFRSAVIIPKIECQSEPDIDVSEKSHRRPDTPQSLRWLSAVVPEFQNKQAGTERDIRKVLIQPTQPQSIRRLAYPRVRELLRRLRSCRYGLYHDFSYTHYHAISHRNQDTILRGAPVICEYLEPVEVQCSCNRLSWRRDSPGRRARDASLSFAALTSRLRKGEPE